MAKLVEDYGYTVASPGCKKAMLRGYNDKIKGITNCPYKFKRNGIGLITTRSPLASAWYYGQEIAQ